jgi:chromosome segregation ATPase
LDQDDDPMLEAKDKEDSAVTLRYPEKLRIGRKSMAILRADSQLMVHAVGNAPEEAETLQTQIADLQAAVRGATARAELAEREVGNLKTEGEILRAKVAEMERQLDEATRPPMIPTPPPGPSVDLNLDDPPPAIPSKKRK